MKEIIGNATTQLAKDVEATCILSVEKKEKEEVSEDTAYLDVVVAVFRKKGEEYDKTEYETRLRKSKTIIPIKELFLEAITKKYLKEGDRVVCVVNQNIGLGYKGILFIFDVDNVFFSISKYNLAENIRTDVIEAVIDIAMEICDEGREGRKIGTAFIVGNKEEILPYIKQLILNPFENHQTRLITDTEMRETIKEFAQLDGVFVIDDKGHIISGGSYLDVDTTGVDLQGVGTRHRCCAAITKKIPVIAVIVSSSKAVKVFKDGKQIMKLP